MTAQCAIFASRDRLSNETYPIHSLRNSFRSSSALQHDDDEDEEEETGLKENYRSSRDFIVSGSTVQFQRNNLISTVARYTEQSDIGGTEKLQTKSNVFSHCEVQ